jgi:hypothetical protein
VSRRQKVAAAAVAIVLVLLYGGAAATASGPGSGAAAARPGGLVGWMGGLFGKPPKVTPQAVVSPCLNGRTLTVENSCVLTVAKGSGTRRVALRAAGAVDVTSRPPGGTAPAAGHVAAGADVDVTVDGDGGDITLTCTCTLTLG